MSLRIVFMGTGKLAEPVFRALCTSEHSIVGLVTQPDRTGAGHHRHSNPLKELALERQMPVLQPPRLRAPEATAELRALNAELFVVAAYGQILSREVLDMPRLGTINVHASLLPRHRGATPIHAAVLNGDAETGITIIRLVPQLDAGPMLGVTRLEIGDKETTGELETRLAEVAPALTLSVIEQLAAGTAQPVEQDEALATHVGKLEKSDGRIPWGAAAAAVERHIRGMQPWPAPFTTLHQTGKPDLRLQILQADVETEALASNAPPEATGTVLASDSSSFVVRCGSGALRVLRVHPDGKRPMSVADFLRGRPVHAGDHLE